MDSIYVYPIFSIPALMISAAGILICLLVLELKRNSKYRVLNIILQIVVVFALLGLALRPGVKKEVDPTPVILLTNHFNERVIDSLLSEYDTPMLLHTNGNSFMHSTSLESIDQLDGKDVFVVGDGIPEYNLSKLKAATFHFISSQRGPGIQSLLLEEPFTVNRWGRIVGKVNIDITNSTLLLRGPEGILDSIHYLRPGMHLFELKFRPRLEGNFLYSLEQKDSVGKLLFSEPLPLMVFKERKLDVLILQDFPTVEMRFLKNYLGEKDHRIAIRYSISRNIDRFEFVNREKLSLSRISETLLNEFDVLIISSLTYKSMTADMQRVLKRSVQMGLGVVVLLENDTSGSIAELLQLELKQVKHDTVRVLLEGEGYYSIPVADVSVTGQELVSVLKGGEKEVQGYTSSGMGRIGFQMLHESYLFLLSEKPGVYAGIWSPLLEEVARKKRIENQIQIKSPFPWFEDEPLDVQVISSASDPNLNINGTAFPLIEDSRIDGIWTSTIWPQSGWNQLSLDSVRLNFYVAEDGDWSTLRRVNQIISNQLAEHSVGNAGLEKVIIEEKLSPLIFFTAFLLAAGALWLIPKL